MAPKMTPEKLRAQAKELLEKAEREEEKRQVLIGKLVSEMVDRNFVGFNVDLFKEQARQLWEHGRLKKTVKKDSLKAV